MITIQETKQRAPAIVNIPQIRIIELVTIFTIIYVAKEIAGFTYRTNIIIPIFLGAAMLTLLATSVKNFMAGRHQLVLGMRHFWEWLTIGIDLATVIALIYLTGTVESPFMILIIVPLFFAGRLLPAMQAGIIVTIVCVVSVGGLGLLELKGIIPHHSCFPGGNVLINNPQHLVGTVLVLAGFMSFMTYLFSTFYKNFNVYVRSAEDRILSSQRRIVELTRLYDISLGINSVISLETLLKMVCKEITLLLGRSWASVILLNQREEIIKHIEIGEEGVESLEPSGYLEGDPFIAEVLGHEDGVRIDDVDQSEAASSSRWISDRGIRTILAVSIFSGKDTLGLLVVGDRVPECFTQEDARFLTILSGQVATAIDKSRLYEVMSGRISRLEVEKESLQNANKMKMNYISHLSHELKTPLTSIKAYVESLEDHIDDPGFNDRDEFLGVVNSETDRLIRMVNKVLDVSKIEFGQRTLKRKLFQLHSLIDDVTNSLQPYLKDKQLRLAADLPPALPMIDGDEDLIKQVFINLIGNAIKFTPDGSTIYVDVVEDAVSVKITVRDEGVGIPEEDQKNIFKQFYQVPERKGEGVGLGLAIVKNILEQHGCYIQVASTIGEGSTFTFNLPKEHHFNDMLGYIFESMEARDEIQEMFQLSVKVVAEMLSAKIVSLMLLDQEKKELFIKVAYGLDEAIVSKTRVSLGTGIAGKVAETGEPLLVGDVEKSGIKGVHNDKQYETKSFLSVPLKIGSAVIGVINANNKTSGETFSEDDLTLLLSLSQRLSKIIERVRVSEDSIAFLRETIESLRSLIVSQKMDSTGQGKRMTGYSVSVARKLRLRDKEVQVVQYCSSVHDVGMTRVSDRILKKTLELTPEEIIEIRKHPEQSAEIVHPFEFVELVSKNILFHHERMDGKGYPMGLKGEQIPIGSRILAVLDAYASMTSDRPYRKCLTVDEAIEELLRHSDTQFDRNVVAAFVEVIMDEGKIGVEEYSKISDRLRSAGKHHVLP